MTALAIALAAVAPLVAALAAWWVVRITIPTVRYWRSRRRKEMP